jgi:hypothetical protein
MHSLIWKIARAPSRALGAEDDHVLGVVQPRYIHCFDPPNVSGMDYDMRSVSKFAELR